MPCKRDQDGGHHIPKQKHKATNQREYDASLPRRGSPMVWFTGEAIEAWAAQLRTARCGQPCRPALAFLTTLTLRAAIRLACRQF